MLSCFYILDSMHLVASTPTREVSVYVYSGSTMYRVWTCCDALLVTPVERLLPEVERWYTSYPVPTLVVVEAASYLIDFLPHLVIAAVAGLVTRFVCRADFARVVGTRLARPNLRSMRSAFVSGCCRSRPAWSRVCSCLPDGRSRRNVKPWPTTTVTGSVNREVMQKSLKALPRPILPVHPKTGRKPLATENRPSAAMREPGESTNMPPTSHGSQ